MQKTEIRLICAAAALFLYASSAVSQTAALTGHILDYNRDTPIKNAHVIIEGRLSAISNSEGKYQISGLAVGKTIRVRYEAKDYGDTNCQVTLREAGKTISVTYVAISPAGHCSAKPSRDTTDNTVHLLQNLPVEEMAAYWSGVSKSAMNAAGDPVPLKWASVYGDIWKDLDGSNLPAEAKASAAHTFAGTLPPGGVAESPSTFQAYSKVNPGNIAQTKGTFDIVIDGKGTLKGVKPVVPGNVAADIAAHELFLRNKSAKIPDNFMTGFTAVYGGAAGGLLQNKVMDLAQ